jgi:transcription antitermination factor NusG
MIEVPLFAAYVFVKTTDETLRTLTKINGVSRIVFYNGCPAVINESEIESIKVFVENANGKKLVFGVDDEVLVACGPLKNKSGKLLKVGKKYVVLHIQQLGLTVSLKTDQIIKSVRFK